jgi:acetyl-CoA C-acetyltransferase/acetyl-CoA acyltransferase
LTHFGNHPERTGRDLFAEAGLAALEDAGDLREDVEALNYGNFMGELTEHQGHQGPLMAEAVGLRTPATRYEAACASSGAAIREAVRAIRGGEADVIMAGGAERMTNVGTAEATDGLAIAADDLYEIRAGMTFPAAYGLMAQEYFERYGGTREDLAHVAVKNHEHALDSPRAQLRKEITVDEALAAPMVATPLGLYDCCPITDGAAALVLTSDTYADEHDLDAPVGITGTGQGGDNLALQDRPYLAQTPSATEATEEAFEDAGVGPDDVDAVEVHDCFTIAEVMALEAMGFFEPGEAISAAREGTTTRHGDLPVNLSGGLKAKGHPVGATGATQVATLAWLLDGSHRHAGDVPDAQVAVAHNAGGTAASTTLHVMEVVE